MPYCPVILEIKHTELKEIINGNYILQVFNLSGDCVFDKVLKCKYYTRLQEGNNFYFIWICNLYKLL